MQICIPETKREKTVPFRETNLKLKHLKHKIMRIKPQNFHVKNTTKTGKVIVLIIKKTKQTPRLSARKRTTPTGDRRGRCKILLVEGIAWSSQRILTAVNLGFLDWSR
jgi:hypothetical protein